eukprot:Awhi_evm1s5027
MYDYLGKTHFDDTSSDEGLFKVKHEMFFAPTEIVRRLKEWGPELYEEKAKQVFNNFMEGSKKWLSIEKSFGAQEAQDKWLTLVDNQVSPQEGIIVNMNKK